MYLDSIGNLGRAQAVSCAQTKGETIKVLQVYGFEGDDITIKASAGRGHWEPMQYEDGSDMVINGDCQISLPVGNYSIRAISDGNEATIILA
jgi:hypothetical protein